MTSPVSPRWKCGLPSLFVALIAAFGSFDCASNSTNLASDPDAGVTRDQSVAEDLLGDQAGGNVEDGSETGPADGNGSGCPPYQSLCNGSCLPTSADPENCGGCGRICTGAQACSAGACATSCLLGLSICNNACVDVESDSAHCGGCNLPCGPGTGCVAGQCEPALPVNPAGVACDGAGPPVIFGGLMMMAEGCAGALAQTTFQWALCSCKDVQLSGSLLTDGFDSSAGPYTPGGLGGGVGVNQRFAGGSSNEIWGALWGSSAMGIKMGQESTIKQELHCGGPFQAATPWTVGEDAFINGDVMTSSSLGIAGTLHSPPGATITAGVTDASLATELVSVPPPCDCGPGQLVPVPAIVDYQSSHNDNALIGLDAKALMNPSGPLRLDLPCGRYYLSAIQSSYPITIVAHGRTGLFIGNLQASAAVTLTLDLTAELDVFVKDVMGAAQTLSVGSPNYPALTRLYIGSPMGLSLSANDTLAANVYAGYGPIKAASALEVYGSIFAGDFSGLSEVAIHYDRQVLKAGGACPSRDANLDGGVSMDGASGPGAPPMCNSCRDCGNQACVNGACGACATSADCCSPLVCEAGRCVLFPQQG